MEANELMIGDLVRHINGTPYQVTCIKDGHFACSIPHLWEYNNKFEPIPLTAEILEKNGFKNIKWNEFGEESSEGEPTNIFRCELETKCLMIKVEVGIYKPNFIIISAPDDCGGEVEISNICKIDGSDIMLHELQHALRLCGIDKEIVL